MLSLNTLQKTRNSRRVFP